ncbi:MAG: NAD-dependent epimerase/dehydratase family protein [Patescibacteria group bacterium]|nr:NAD-dependent epimerase/dehydratase family protein [Patescibacteria group bacterium]
MKILVTGGAGFIGSHVVDLLVEAGHAVTVFDNLSAGVRENVRTEANLLELDVNSVEAARAVVDFAPEAVIHLAAQIDLRRSVADPVADAEINILGGVRMLQAAAQARARTFVFASSSAVYGQSPAVPTPESYPTDPVSPYGAAKLAMENYLNVFRVTHGLHCAAFRFSNVYGPRQGGKGEGGVVSVFANDLAVGRPPRINGDGEQTRDFLFVEDAARLLTMAAERGMDGVFNASAGRETSINDLYAKLSRLAGVTTEPEHVAAVPNETRRSCLSAEKVAQSGWRAEMKIDDGLRQAWEWFSTRPR